MSTVQEIKKMC